MPSREPTTAIPAMIGVSRCATSTGEPCSASRQAAVLGLPARMPKFTDMFEFPAGAGAGVNFTKGTATIAQIAALDTGRPTASQRITAEVMSWPGVEAGPGRRGEFAFTVGRRPLGHLHGDRAAHLSFPRAVWAQLCADSEADLEDVIALLRLNYDRAAG